MKSTFIKVIGLSAVAAVSMFLFACSGGKDKAAESNAPQGTYTTADQTDSDRAADRGTNDRTRNSDLEGR